MSSVQIFFPQFSNLIINPNATTLSLVQLSLACINYIYIYAPGLSRKAPGLSRKAQGLSRKECKKLQWTDTQPTRWSRHETKDGQVVVFITITKDDFQCFYEELDIAELNFDISFEERITLDIIEGKCYTNNDITTSTTSTTTSSPTITTPITTITSTTTRTSTTTEQTAMRSITKSITIERWREYELKLTITDPKTNSLINKIVQYDTFEWHCGDPGGNVISQKEFCNNEPDCEVTAEYPNGRDEDPSVCRVSELPKNLGYLVYLLMTVVIAVYFSRKSLETNTISELIHSTTSNVNIVCPNQLEIFELKEGTEIFILEYYSMHSSSAEIISFSHKIKLWHYNQKDMEMMVEVFSNIRLAEERLHDDAEERYLCILKHFGGDATVTERICCPEGTLLDKLKQYLQKILNQFYLFLNKTAPSPIPWYALDIGFGFLCLCSHLFDYIKDIGIKMLYHRYFLINLFQISQHR